jgi:hypothetical protein
MPTVDPNGLRNKRTNKVILLRLSHVGFVVDKVALGQVFFGYFGFPPLPNFIPPISPPSPIIRGWYNRPVVATVSKVPPH